MFLHKVLNVTLSNIPKKQPFNDFVARNRSNKLFYLPNTRTRIFEQLPLYRMCDTFNKVEDVNVGHLLNALKQTEVVKEVLRLIEIFG